MVSLFNQEASFDFLCNECINVAIGSAGITYSTRDELAQKTDSKSMAPIGTYLHCHLYSARYEASPK